MPWSEIVGQDEPLDRLRRSVASGRLAHTYAFVGPAGVGKRRFAVQLARCLLCQRHAAAELEACGQCPACQQVAARTHPDLHEIRLPDGKSELPLELFVGDREHRGRAGLCYELSLHPMAGGRKIALIDDADCFNAESGNALLKTLEEPPRDSLIILLASTADALLPTIRSRCQVIPFRALAEADLRRLLVREGLVEQEADAAEIARLCDGSLETARQLLDPRLRELRRTLYDHLASEPFQSAQLAQQMNEGVEAAGGDKAAQRAAAGWAMRFMIEFFRMALWRLSREELPAAAVPQVERFAEQLARKSRDPHDRLGELIDRCFAADRQLDANITIPLCLEALFDDLGRILRA